VQLTLHFHEEMTRISRRYAGWLPAPAVGRFIFNLADVVALADHALSIGHFFFPTAGYRDNPLCRQ